MKHFLMTLLVAATFFTAQAQLKTPAPSPSATVSQTVGLTDVTVEYSRPGKKDRDIFSADGLVPFGKLWRTGANAATKITFSKDVKVGGKELKKGSYAILTKPAATQWMVFFYPYEGRSWSSYTEKEAAATVSVTPKKTAHTVETFTISIDDLKVDGATLKITWDNVTAPVKLMVHTNKQAEASIEKLLNGPSKGEYFNIASYYHTTANNPSKALEYINKATAGTDKKFWHVRRKALILADLGKKKEAIMAAKESLKLAKIAGNDDYIRMNEASIAKWSKM